MRASHSFREASFFGPWVGVAEAYIAPVTNEFMTTDHVILGVSNVKKKTKSGGLRGWWPGGATLL